MRRALLIALGLAVLVAAVAATLVLRRDARSSVVRSAATLTLRPGVRLATERFTPDDVDRRHRAPAVLLAQGLGEDLSDLRTPARHLAAQGYIVVTWNPRGIGDSTGDVGIADPATDVPDVASIVDALAAQPDVLLDAAGDPRVAIVGTSLGGGLALVAAARDERIDAVASIFGWYSLPDALQPNGVLKLAWASNLFAASSGDVRVPKPCANLEPGLCAAWSASVAKGAFTPAALRALTLRSPSSSADNLHAPTLIVQGQYDSLFDFRQATALARALAANHTPHRVEWVRAGHDADPGLDTQRHVDLAIGRWLDRYLRRDASVDTGAPLTIQLGSGRGYGSSEHLPARSRAHRVSLSPAMHTDRQGRVRLAAPPGGLPANTTTLPGLGDVTQLGESTSAPRGSVARFEGPAERAGLELVGSPTVRFRVASNRPDVTLFVHLVDIAPSGQRLIPRALVTPVRLEGVPALDAPTGSEVAVTLPPIAWRVAPQHRLGLEVASTDAGYVANAAPQTIAISIEGNEFVTVPIVTGLTVGDDGTGSGASHTARNRFIAAGTLAAAALLAALLASLVARRRDREPATPALARTPVVVEQLAKRYRGRVTAVADVSFAVEPGSIVGLVGPNGAGKTTVLRLLLGLARPSAGRAFVFGHRVRPGAPVLRRVGALVEGPGLAPHHTGRQHLERYWGATGRPRAEADIEAALAAVELTGDAHRRVSTWSHGMRQRLGIAQALLGDPDVVVLDEPTNGLDPAQIRHLRDLIRGVAASGRTVLLSSHLLSELEQVSTHVVLMANGRVLDQGTLADVIGDHDDLESAFLAVIAEAGDA
ncbi:MAG: alpha/beta fold hydrolase [Thermoleophilia bacterium]|nr:alpha/beta fold hydrolase [Thermoleophilia bacterium]